jgi:NAD+ diphosphatase
MPDLTPELLLPALSRSVVDRAAAERMDPVMLTDAWSRRGQVLILDGELAAPVRPTATGLGLRWESATGALPEEALFLGDDGHVAFFALHNPDGAADRWDRSDGPSGGGRRGLREIGDTLDDQDAGLLTHAVALARWHERHAHCPQCGAPTRSEQGGSVRRCTVDGSEHFPRTDPAMIVLVTDPDGTSAVLGRGAAWPPGFLSCLAGFVEAGESAEQAVVREVAEEVGLRVRSVHYVASQPWPFPCSLMLGFRAVAERAELNPAAGEIAEARWLTRDEMQAEMASGALAIPPRVSIARHLIDGWLAEG